MVIVVVVVVVVAVVVFMIIIQVRSFNKDAEMAIIDTTKTFNFTNYSMTLTQHNPKVDSYFSHFINQSNSAQKDFLEVLITQE